jgi:GNAT superfamily N-acetyltransferase
MKATVERDLVVARVDSDVGLHDMIAVRSRTDPDLPPPRLENLRHNLDSDPSLAYFVARLGGEAVGCGFAELLDVPYAAAHVLVVEEARRRGVGSALLRAVSAHAAAADKAELQGEAREDDARSRVFFERRGFVAVGGEQAVALDLSAHVPEPAEPPDGIRIVSRAEEPNVLEGMYAVAVEADEDIPGNDDIRTFEQFRAQDVDRPTRVPELCFVALAGDEVVGYAVLDDFGSDAFHGLTAVKRTWRRRGVATALKRTQIAAAKERGFRRLITESEERNLPMRRLNDKLGYRPEPSLSTVVLRGPLLL